MLLKNSPTAQAWPELGSAAAALRVFSLALGSGLGTTLQLVPFHCSISACPLPPASPTAHTSAVETAAGAVHAAPSTEEARGLPITLPSPPVGQRP